MKSADARQIDIDSQMVAKSRQKSCQQDKATRRDEAGVAEDKS